MNFRYGIGVGANLGERAATITAAAHLLTSEGSVRLLATSRLHETTAQGDDQPQQPYLNGAWIVESDLGAHQLLHTLQRIEHGLGRARTRPCGPRTIDLDLLLRDDGLIIASGVLALPHPRLHVRRFVLEPLQEIAGGWRHPLLALTVDQMLARLAPSA